MSALGEFYENAVHTDRSEVREIRDTTADEFLIKMATADATVTFDFDRDLFVTATTPFGRYRFILNHTGDKLVVDQII